MAPDIFGNTKEIKSPGAIITSEFATLTMNGRMALVQSVTANYARQLNTMFEAGASTVFYLQGASEGKIDANSAVGTDGFFKNFRNLGCGEVTNVNIDVNGNNCTKGQGGLSFNGALAEAFTTTFQAGPTAVTQGITLRVGSMTVR